MRFKKLKIGQKLLAGFVLVIALGAIQGIFGRIQMFSIEHQVTDIESKGLPSVLLADQLNSQMQSQRAAVFKYAMTTDTNQQTALGKTIDELEQSIADTREKYEMLIASDDEIRIYADFGDAWRHFVAARGQVLQSARNLDSTAMREQLDKAEEAFKQCNDALSQLIKLNQDGATGQVAKIRTAIARTSLAIYGGLGLMIVLGVLIALRLSGAISKRISAASGIAQKVAQGQLANVIQKGAADEIGDLLQALEQMQTQLSHTVADVRRGAHSVASASAEIAQGNQDLSERTEQQASALEETAATMEQIGEQVRQNAENVRQANQLAVAASAVAEQGGTVVGQVVDTMKEINQSSRKISDIIGVIDGIAFQTNILALNAAVEAARAGEQGRGFAVVASEVRSLAGRSAEAAKEIKTLIGASVSRVEQGTSLVDRAGATMTEVVASIKRMTDLVAEISAATGEQAMGIAQIGEAVGHMDQTTQQNAALVEQMAAAAGSLRAQATQLVSTVAVFQADEHAGFQTDFQAETPAPARVTPPTVTPAVAHVAKPATSHVAKPVAAPTSAPAPARVTATATSDSNDEWETF